MSNKQPRSKHAHSQKLPRNSNIQTMAWWITLRMKTQSAKTLFHNLCENKELAPVSQYYKHGHRKFCCTKNNKRKKKGYTMLRIPKTVWLSSLPISRLSDRWMPDSRQLLGMWEKLFLQLELLAVPPSSFTILALCLVWKNRPRSSSLLCSVRSRRKKIRPPETVCARACC